MTKPNWRNADDYKFTDDLSYPEWAWEFLRRNPEYRKDWNEIKATHRGEYPGHHVVNGRLHPENMQDAELIDIRARKWGLSIFFPNPDEPHGILHNWNLGGLYGPGYGWNMEDPRYKVIAFDLTIPIDNQIEMAKSWLHDTRQERVKNGEIELIPDKRDRSTDWKNYLRVLDADSVGAIESDKAGVARVLVPDKENIYPDYAGSKTIDNWFSAAKKLRDVEYIALSIMSSETSTKKRRKNITK